HLEGLGVPGDEPLLADGEVRYKGQPIAAVAAESEEAAQAAVEAIEIAYEPRPALFDIRQALDPDAPKIHQWGNVYPHYGPFSHRRVRKGDVAAAFDRADTAADTICALLALKSRQAVKWRWTREEEFLASSTRAAWHIEIADAVTKDGWILGRRTLTLHDSGAYARFSPYGVTKHAFHHS